MQALVAALRRCLPWRLVPCRSGGRRDTTQRGIIDEVTHQTLAAIPGRMLSLLLTAAMAAAAMPAPAWQSGLDWHGTPVTMTRDAQGSFTLA
jgi:hypothetical protein